jgi:hypothetical protein
MGRGGPGELRGHGWAAPSSPVTRM